METINTSFIQKIKKKFGFTEEDKLLRLFRNKNGIEVGGPSSIFSTEIPLYKVIKSLDGCNFSNNTVWEGVIKKGLNYNYYQNKIGYQYINEASNLKETASNKYDFLLASHCLEHCANPLKTIKEWLRVIKPKAYLLLILPDKEYTFDHKRETTSFEHLIEDYKDDIDEEDLTHLEEILLLHDLSMDTPAGDLINFNQRSLNNYHNRCLHHHVFDFRLLKQIFKYFEIKIKYERLMVPYHQIIVGQKINLQIPL